MNTISKQSPLRILLWVFVLAGLAAALVSARDRWRAEVENRSVEITLDWAEVRTLAASSGMPIALVLREFKQAGATSVAVTEDTVGGLEDSRRMQVPASPNPDSTTLVMRTPEMATRIEQALRFKTHLAPKEVAGQSGVVTLSVPAPFNQVRGVGVGLDPDAVAVIQNAGLAVVGRISNWRGIRPEGLVWALHELKGQGVSTVIFVGDEVLGWKGYIADDPKRPGGVSTAAAFRDTGLRYGLVEFGKQKGDIALARAAAPETVRVHTVTGPEMFNADMPSNVQRFLLAARERDIRVLYVRLFTDEKDALRENATKYIAKIAKGLPERGDLQPGLAHGYGPLAVPVYLKALIGLGIAAAWVLLVDAVTGLLTPGPGRPGSLVGAAAGLGALVLVALPLAPVALGVKLAALAAACIYPALALLQGDPLGEDVLGKGVGNALLRFARMTLVTSLGVAAIIGLLADRLFLLKVEAFMGIKGAQLVPVLLVVLAYGLDLRAGRGRTWAQAVAAARERVGRLASQPVLIWQVAAGVGALVVLALLVMRSGNDPGVGVSGMELKIRAVLDRILYARPRFKEFLIGHPAMVLALLFAARGRRLWALPLFVVGAIGQVSYLNTFCHIHTPIPFSLARALIGVAVGVIIGLVLNFPLQRLLDRLSAGGGAPAAPVPPVEPALRVPAS